MEYKPEENQINYDQTNMETNEVAQQEPPAVDQKEEKHTEHNFVAIVSILVLIIAVGGYYFWNNINTPKEHLIQNVPYEVMDSSIPFSVYSVLNYYGDGRFTKEQINMTFVHDPSQKEFTGENIASFFGFSGYSTLQKNASSVSKIKNFILNDVPVIIYRDLEDNDTENINVFIVIGYSDLNDTLIINDNISGENFEMSYEEFSNLTSEDSQEFVVITPAGDLDRILENPIGI